MVSLRLFLIVCGTVFIYANDGFPLPPGRSSENTVENTYNNNNPSQQQQQQQFGNSGQTPPPPPTGGSNIFSGIRPLRPLDQIPPSNQQQQPPPPPHMPSGAGVASMNTIPSNTNGNTHNNNIPPPPPSSSVQDQLFSSYQSGAPASSNNGNNNGFPSHPGSFNGPPAAPPGSQRIINMNTNDMNNDPNHRPPVPPQHQWNRNNNNNNGQPPRKLPSIFHQNTPPHQVPITNTPVPQPEQQQGQEQQTLSFQDSIENTNNYNNNGGSNSPVADSQSRATQVPLIPSAPSVPSSTASATVTSHIATTETNENTDNSPGVSRTTNIPSSNIPPGNSIPSGTTTSTINQQHTTNNVASASSTSSIPVTTPMVPSVSTTAGTVETVITDESSVVPLPSSPTIVSDVTSSHESISTTSYENNPIASEDKDISSTVSSSLIMENNGIDPNEAIGDSNTAGIESSTMDPTAVQQETSEILGTSSTDNAAYRNSIIESSSDLSTEGIKNTELSEQYSEDSYMEQTDTELPTAALSSLTMFREENSLEDKNRVQNSDGTNIYEKYSDDRSGHSKESTQQIVDDEYPHSSTTENANIYQREDMNTYEQDMQYGQNSNHNPEYTEIVSNTLSDNSVPSPDFPVSEGDNPYYHDSDYAIYMAEEGSEYADIYDGGDNNTSNTVKNTSEIPVMNEETIHTVTVGADGGSEALHYVDNGWPMPPGHQHQNHQHHDHHHHQEVTKNTTEYYYSRISNHSTIDGNQSIITHSSMVNETTTTPADTTVNKTLPPISSISSTTVNNNSSPNGSVPNECKDQLVHLQQNLTRAQNNLNFIPAFKSSIYAWGNLFLLVLQQMEPYTGPIASSLGMLYEEHVDPVLETVEKAVSEIFRTLLPIQVTVYTVIEEGFTGNSDKESSYNVSTKESVQHIRDTLDGISTSLMILVVYYFLRIWYKVMFSIVSCGGLCCCCCRRAIDDEDESKLAMGSKGLSSASANNLNALSNAVPPLTSPPKQQGPPTSMPVTNTVPNSFGLPSTIPKNVTASVPPTTTVKPEAINSTASGSVPSLQDNPPNNKPKESSLQSKVLLPPENVLKQNLHLMSPEVQSKVLSLMASPGGIRSTVKRKAVVGGVDNSGVNNNANAGKVNTSNLSTNPVPPSLSTSSFVTSSAGTKPPPSQHPINALTFGENIPSTPDKTVPSKPQTVTTFRPPPTDVPSVINNGKTTHLSSSTTGGSFSCGPPRPASKSVGSTSSHQSQKAPWEVPQAIEEENIEPIVPSFYPSTTHPTVTSSYSTTEETNTVVPGNTHNHHHPDVVSTNNNTLTYIQTDTYGNNPDDTSYTLPSINTTNNDDAGYTLATTTGGKEEYDNNSTNTMEQQQQQLINEQQIYVQEQQRLGRPYDYLGEHEGIHYYGYNRIIDTDQGPVSQPIYMETR